MQTLLLSLFLNYIKTIKYRIINKSTISNFIIVNMVKKCLINVNEMMRQ